VISCTEALARPPKGNDDNDAPALLLPLPLPGCCSVTHQFPLAYVNEPIVLVMTAVSSFIPKFL